MTLIELQELVVFCNSSIKAHRLTIDKAVKEIRSLGTCDHSITSTHEEDRDNGYGKWWKQTIETCQYCGSRRSIYATGLNPGSWQSYNDWLNS